MSDNPLADAVRALKAELDEQEDVFNLYDPDAPDTEPWAQLVLIKGRHIRIKIDEA
jgi:hypothetical protein